VIFSGRLSELAGPDEAGPEERRDSFAIYPDGGALRRENVGRIKQSQTPKNCSRDRLVFVGDLQRAIKRVGRSR